MKQRNKAFSLVELSIVLVILGLLVGGILAGRSLIRASELRAITVEKDKFTAAIFAFRDAYAAWPGDLANAYKFWSTDCGTDTTASGTGCNGDGNGFIDPTLGENVKAWEHLSRAGFIEGSYDGNGTVTVGYVQLGQNNVPASKFPKAYWNVSVSPSEGGTLESTSNSAPLLAIGLIDSGSYSSQSWLASLTSLKLSEAYGIDLKIDDGLSDTGAVSGGHDGMCVDSPSDPYSMTAEGAESDSQCIIATQVK